eukprot:m.5596 g.5596  ORF g.5596 m.5596 type:complete len:197 (-) comp5067_c0_seq1:221-811(-)
MLELTDLQKIGVVLTGFGVFFLFLGVIFFFDHGLLAMGNVFFLGGVACVIGLSNTFTFFFQPKMQKIKGSTLFFSGILTILWFSSILGMIIETIGLYYLFAGFLPAVVTTAQRLPVIGTVLSMPPISTVCSGCKNTNDGCMCSCTLMPSFLLRLTRCKIKQAHAHNPDRMHSTQYTCTCTYNLQAIFLTTVCILPF